MTQISAALVKQLRDKTGAGMMDCKKALQEVEGDLDAATDWLRAKGLAAAQKKAGRVAAEGLVAVAVAGTTGAIVEVNAETDFVARNEQFQAFVGEVAALACEHGDNIDALRDAGTADGGTVADRLSGLVATIGENMSLRRCRRLSVEAGVVGSYIHAGIAPGLGRIGVLVALKSTAPSDDLNALAHKIAMHIAASAPQSVAVADLDPVLVARERAVLAEQARESGKPENIIEKMVEGRLRKFYQDVVLAEQTWVHDGDLTVQKAIDAEAKRLNTQIEIAAFERYVLGEGIERAESDFAAEVAAQAAR